MKTKILLAFIFSGITVTALAEMPVVLLDEPIPQQKQFTHKHSEKQTDHPDKASAGGVKRAKNPRNASSSPTR